MDTSGFFKNTKVIVTGGTGSVGQEIVTKLLAMDLGLIRVLDNNESALFEMEMAYRDYPNIEFYHCDITDIREMRRTFSGMDYCFHSAALKHVPSCERSPYSAVSVNIQGCENVGQVAMENNLKKVIFTSSDKAVNPTNVMGTSKLMGERLFTAMNFLQAKSNQTVFSSTRFGNVLGSRGSVVPLFVSQISRGGPVTVTDNKMTRFVMTLSQAADLVIESMILAKGGEVFVTKMPVLKIKDLARVMIDRIAPLKSRDPADISITITGSRPGEKLWEELSTDEEAGRLLEGEKFLIVLPAGHTKTQLAQDYTYERIAVQENNQVYHSDRQPVMSEAEIWDMLRLPGVLAEDVTSLI